MAKPLKICLVTPSFQQGNYIERAVRSVLSQQGEGFALEYFARDAESSDETARVLAALQKEYAQYPDFTVRIQTDDGQAAALAEEFARTDADVLGWLNADDLLRPGALATVAQTFRRHSPDVVYGRAHFIDANDKITGYYPDCNHDIRHLRTICYLSQPSVFFTRRLYEQVGGLRTDLHYCLDYNLWLRFAAAQGKFHRVKQVLSATRLHQVSKTSTGGLAFADEIMRMQQETFGDVPEPWRLYRRYRELALRSAAVPGFICYGLALGEYLFKSPSQFPRLCGWSLRVGMRMLLARLGAG